MAILGGALLTQLQGKLIDIFSGGNDALLGEATAKSYIVPLVCFVVVAFYGLYASKTDQSQEG